MDGIPGISPGIPVTPEPVQAIPVWRVENPVQVVHSKDGDHACWAVVSRFDSVEACKWAQTVVSAFDKLGYHKLAHEIQEDLDFWMPRGPE